MIVLFEDEGKKFKSSFLKTIESNLKILKLLYDEVYINSDGIAYSLKSNLENGRVFCNTNIDEVFNINKDELIKLNLKALNDCFKLGKTKIIGYEISNDDIIFRTTEMDYNIGSYERAMKLNIDYLNEIVENVEYKCNLNNLIERFINKEFVNVKQDKYDLILTHKLFPGIIKSNNFDFSAKSNDNGTFYGVFRNLIEERNKKDELIFGIQITYIYRFLDLN